MSDREIIYNIATEENTPSDIFFETFDINWYAADVEGLLVQFSSMVSGFIPPEVRNRYSEVKVFNEHIIDLTDISDVEYYKAHFPDEFRSEKSKLSYLKGTAWFARKGLYSYLPKDYNRKGQNYKIICSPKKKLRLEQVPDHILNSSFIIKLNIKLSKLPKIIRPEDIITS